MTSNKFHLEVLTLIKKIFKSHYQKWNYAIPSEELDRIIIDEIPAELLVEIYELLTGKRERLSHHLLKELVKRIWSQIKFQKKLKVFSSLLPSEAYHLANYLPEGEVRFYYS